MSRQNIVNAALNLERELKELDRTKDPSVLIRTLRDELTIARYDSATLVGKSKIAGLEVLIGRMPNMSNNMLIIAIEILSQIGTVDIDSITSFSQVKRRIDFVGEVADDLGRRVPGHANASPPAGKSKELNIPRQDIVDAALDLERWLEELDRTKDPSALMKALRDELSITRYDFATLVEKSRIAALKLLIGRMSNMSDNMLFRTIETLSKIGTVDITSISGSSQVKG
jgi:Zn finger protein HypA/HybF involved in hydrogenase expression